MSVKKVFQSLVLALGLITLFGCNDKTAEVRAESEQPKQELKVRKWGESGFTGFSSANAMPDHIKPGPSQGQDASKK